MLTSIHEYLISIRNIYIENGHIFPYIFLCLLSFSKKKYKEVKKKRLLEKYERKNISGICE